MLTDKQKLERKKGIGGSDVASILGISPWKTSLQLWIEKTSELSIKDEEDNEAMYWGNVMEPILRAEYERRTGNKVLSSDEIVAHPVHKFMIAHVDGVVLDNKDGVKLLEIKTASQFKSKDWGKEETDQLPDYYLTQIHHYMCVYDARECDVAVLIGGNQFKIYTVIKDREMDKLLIEHETKFWNCVETNTPPSLQNTSDWHLLHAKNLVDMELEITTEYLEYVNKLADIQQQIKILETDAEKLKINIMEFMGNHKNLLHDNKKIGQITVINDSLNWDLSALEKNHEIKNLYYTKQKKGYSYFKLSNNFKEKIK